LKQYDQAGLPRPAHSASIRTIFLLGLLLGLAAGCREGGSAAAPESAAVSPQTAVATTPENVDLSLMDPAVTPGDDFFTYANGAWLSSYELPVDKSTFGNFYALHEQAQDRVQALIEELAAAEPAPGSVEQKIGDYYASFLDTGTLDALGFAPIKADLAHIKGLSDHSALSRAFSWASRAGGSAPLALGIQIDRMNPARFIGAIYASGLGLPERDYYLEDSERFQTIREAYVGHIQQLLALVEAPELAAQAKAVLALETAIARAHWPRADRRNRDLTYNVGSPERVRTDFPGFDWAGFFEAAGATPEVVNVVYPSAIPPIIELIESTPLAVWQAYLAYHLVSNNAPYLATEIDAANFEFYGKVIRGQPEQRERWRRAVSLVSGGNGLGDAIGEVYVARYFPPESKAMMEELVENMRAALSERVDELDWMGDETKARAQEKLAAFLPKIGYPSEWRDFSDVDIDRADLMGNVRSLRGYYEARAIRRLNEPTDRNEWFSPPQTVNAFYSPQFNAITFPAGILEPPFFNPQADPAVNYGAIGAVIGHEMGHGFDDQGSKSNGAGVQENWWTDEDRARFEARADRLVDQYSAYEAVPGTFIDGRFTLGENIGDLGGISIAYHAYRASLEGEEAPIIDGLTGDQRFFIAYAQIWRAKTREETMVARLKSGPHSPEPFRVNGVVRNLDAWYDAFEVGEDAALYLPSEARVRIW